MQMLKISRRLTFVWSTTTCFVYFLLVLFSLFMEPNIFFFCSCSDFGQPVEDKWFVWDIWARTVVWGNLAMGIPGVVLFMWLLRIWPVGYVALSIVWWLDPFNPSAPSNTPCLLYTCVISKCYHQLPYPHPNLWGMSECLLKSCFNSTYDLFPPFNKYFSLWILIKQYISFCWTFVRQHAR